MMHDIESKFTLMLKWLSALPDEPGPADLATVVKYYYQAAYVLTYLEGNSTYVNLADFAEYRRKFFDDDLLRKRLARIFARRWPGADMQIERDSAEWFRRGDRNDDGDAALRNAVVPVRRILRDIDVEREGLMERLGFGAKPMESEIALARALEQIDATSARAKLLLAWSRIADVRAGQLAEAMDRLIDLRWEHAKQQGFRSVAERSFVACGVTVDVALGFVEDYMRQALEERRSFLKIVFPDAPGDDAMRSLLLRSGHHHPPVPTKHAVIGLDSLANLTFHIIERVFGITFSNRDDTGARTTRYDAWHAGDRLGTLTLDLVSPGPSTPFDRGEVMVVADLLQDGYPPEARVLCLLTDANDRIRSLSLEATRVFLHGMGHALVHLAVRPLRPSATGLDTLPLERLEGLSHWFERLMDHDLFEKSVATTIDKRQALHAFRLMRENRLKNTRLEQAMVAAIDLQVHAHQRRGMRAAFDDVTGCMADDIGVSFERVVRFSTAPLFRDYPGAGFVYPWGTAYGAAHFPAFSEEEQATRSLRAYFDRARASILPDPRTEYRIGEASAPTTLEIDASRQVPRQPTGASVK